MGRTIRSFRLASGEEREWKVFRNALDKSDRRIFDEMFFNFTFIQFNMLLCCQSYKSTANPNVYHMSSL
jgi:hypothetical protein